MSNYGFVYILSHPLMPNVYKIGCTDRAPLQRVSELSSSTSIPCPFDLVFYCQVENHKAVEYDLHEFFKESRISTNREFFEFDLEFLFRQVFPSFKEVCLDYSECSQYFLLEEDYKNTPTICIDGEK